MIKRMRQKKKNTCVISWLIHCTLSGQWFTNDDENDNSDKKYVTIELLQPFFKNTIFIKQIKIDFVLIT